MASVKIDAANLLLDRGIRFNIPDAPIWDKIRGRNKIWIKPLRGGTIVEIALLVIERGLDERLTNLQLQTKLGDLAEIIAVAVLNDKDKIATKKEKLAHWLLLKLPARELIKIFRHIENLNRIEGFMTITNYFRRQTMMMIEKRTGQAAKGS